MLTCPEVTRSRAWYCVNLGMVFYFQASTAQLTRYGDKTVVISLSRVDGGVS